MESKNRNIIIAIMLATFLGAVEGTVVTTAIPTIVKSLNGFELMSWIFSMYLLTSTITTPIYGKLSDLYGRKNTLIVGISIFLLGSFLCGISMNMYSLIAFRAIQGIGAGSIFTVTYTIVGDLFAASERAKIQGWVGTVWGIASLLGPFLGGFLIDTLSWHWIFFINIPFGIISIVLLKNNLKENFKKRKVRIDYMGTLVLTTSIVLILYGFLSAGKKSSPDLALTIICISVALALLFVFYFVEKKSKEPIMPFEIFTRVNIVVSIIGFLVSASLIAIDVYMPIYIQNVLGFGATISGICIAPMSFTWLISSIVLSKWLTIYKEKSIILICSIILLLSSFILLTFSVGSSLPWIILCVSIMGFGFGGTFTIVTIVVQDSVDYAMRGAATASNILLRNLGQTIGVSIFGTIFNLSIIKYFQNIGIKDINPSNLYSSSILNSGVSLQLIKESLISGLHLLFICVIGINLISFFFGMLFPKKFKIK